MALPHETLNPLWRQFIIFFDDNISDFAFGFEHFEHFIAKSAEGGLNLLNAVAGRS
jgi:hypothetical protein